jgi:cobalamin-dependent methionine synthase I
MNMSRKNVPFKQYEGKKSKDKHIRLTADMMLCKVYLELSDSAKTVYNYMKLYSCGNDIFEYPASLAAKYTSKSTFLRAKEELLAKGFIEYEQHNQFCRTKNIFKMSGDWRSM